MATQLRPWTTAVLLFLVSALIALLLFLHYGRSIWVPHYLHLRGKRTLQETIARYEAQAEARLLPYFREARVSYPPKRIGLLAFKDTRELHLWAAGADQPYTHIRTYPIKGASGNLGPKLREHDHQVPEGLYRIEGLNPNSSFHLSMKLNYPNAFDRNHAREEGRDHPGNNIFIHGKTLSVGCLAMGDEAIEELFILSHAVGLNNVAVILSPTDFRHTAAPALLADNQPEWVNLLCQEIKTALAAYQ